MSLLYQSINCPTTIVEVLATTKKFIVYTKLNIDVDVPLTISAELFHNLYIPYYNTGETMPEEEKLYIKIPGDPKIKYKILYNDVCYMGGRRELEESHIVYLQIGTKSVFVRTEEDFKRTFELYSKDKEKQRVAKELEDAKVKVRRLEMELRSI